MPSSQKPTTQNPCQKSQSIIAQVVEDDLLLLDEASGQVHQLNPTARAIWQACTGNNSVETIAKLVVENFAVDDATARQDVQATLDNFAALGLIDYASRP